MKQIFMVFTLFKCIPKLFHLISSSKQIVILCYFYARTRLLCLILYSIQAFIIDCLFEAIIVPINVTCKLYFYFADAYRRVQEIDFLVYLIDE